MGILQARILDWVVMPLEGIFPGIELRFSTMQADSFRLNQQDRENGKGYVCMCERECFKKILKYG